MPSAANKLLANALLDPSWKPIGGGLGVLPLGEDEQGNVGFGIPGILRNPLVSAERSWLDTLAESSGINEGDYLDEGTRFQPMSQPTDAFDAASLAPIAGVVMKAARPNASAVARVAEEPGLASVPLDSYPPAPADYWFHGTQNSGFDKYVPDINRRPNGGFNGVSITPYPSEASSYSYFDTAGPDATPGVYPLKVDVQNPFTWDILNPDDGFNRMDQYFPGMKRGGDIWTGEKDWELSNALRDAGFDAIDIVEGPKMLERAVIAPGRVRSALTGEVFFSNPDDAATVPLLARALDQEGALPMDQASRLARAAEQGYQPLYHATRATQPFDAFEIGRPTFNSDITGAVPTTRSAVFATPDREFANSFADGEGSVMPIMARLDNTLDATKGFGLPEDFYARHGLNPDLYTTLDAKNAWQAFDDAPGEAFRNALLADGFDSVRLVENALDKDLTASKVQNTIARMYLDRHGGNVQKALAEATSDAAANPAASSVYEQVKRFIASPASEDALAPTIAILDPARIRSADAAFDPSKVGMNGLLFSNSDEAAMAPLLARALEQEGAPAFSAKAYRGTVGDEFNHRDGRVFMSTSPSVASDYAMVGGVDRLQGPPAVWPTDVSFSNPLIFDANGAPYNKLPYNGEDMHMDLLAAIAKRRGHDGLVVNNVIDPAASFGDKTPATTIAAFKPGTVRSATTGEVLFSNSDEAAMAPLMTRALEAEGALPMDQASRLARAAEQGYDTERVLYHGTGRGGFDAFDLGADKVTGGGLNDQGVFLTPDPRTASRYAMDFGGDAQSVLPLYSRTQQPLTLPPATFERLQGISGAIRSGQPVDEIKGVFLEDDLANLGIKWDATSGVHPIDAIKAAGFDAIEKVAGRGGSEPELLVFDPSNIRSVNAAFDPSKVGMNGLLFSNSDEAAMAPLLARALEGEQPVTARTYHATTRDFDRFIDGAPPSETSTSWGVPGGRGVYSGSQEFANKIARDNPENARIIPLDVTFQKPLRTNFDNPEGGAEISAKAILDAIGGPPDPIADALRSWTYYGPDGNFSWDQADKLKAAASELGVGEAAASDWKQLEILRQYLEAQGYDGVINNMGKAGAPEPEYAAWKPGTMRNALTGDLMYALAMLYGGGASLNSLLLEQPEG